MFAHSPAQTWGTRGVFYLPGGCSNRRSLVLSVGGRYRDCASVLTYTQPPPLPPLPRASRIGDTTRAHRLRILRISVQVGGLKSDQLPISGYCACPELQRQQEAGFVTLEMSTPAYNTSSMSTGSHTLSFRPMPLYLHDAQYYTVLVEMPIRNDE